MSDEYAKARKVVSPWVRGFKPPVKEWFDEYNIKHYLVICPGCRDHDCLTYTGENARDGDHIYFCQSCFHKVKAQTVRAECNLMDVPMEKDQYFTPCVKCEYRNDVDVSEKGGGVIPEICIHYRVEKWWPI